MTDIKRLPWFKIRTCPKCGGQGDGLSVKYREENAFGYGFEEHLAVTCRCGWAWSEKPLDSKEEGAT